MLIYFCKQHMKLSLGGRDCGTLETTRCDINIFREVLVRIKETEAK